MGEAYKYERTAFEVGQDYARYGVSPPDEADAHFMQGYEEKRGAQTRPAQADLFVRKWLQVRFNAWKRNRFVNPEFTPEFLREIATTHCPVSGVEFTYGTGADTDWSVDRIDNDGGYAPRNVAIFTVRVNKAKGSRSIKELLMHGYQVANPGARKVAFGFKKSTELTKVEWQKLAWFAATTEKNGDYPVREVFDWENQATHLVDPWCCHFQRIMINYTTKTVSERNWFWDSLRSRSKTPEARAILAKLRKSVEAYASAIPHTDRTANAAFANDGRFTLFAEWWIWLARTGELKALLSMVEDIPPEHLVSVTKFREDKAAATDGFA